MRELAREKKLSSFDLFKLFGKIRFSWDLQSDVIHWYGPLNKFLDVEAPLTSGTNYLNRINPEQFWKRLKGASQMTGSHYLCSYTLYLANHESCQIEEEGEIVKNEQGLPVMISGSIRAIDASDKEEYYDLSGYDSITGFPKKEILVETIASLMDCDKNSPAPGVYLCFSIDKLSLVYFHFGSEILENTIKSVGKKIRSSIRFNDVIGRISGSCFGVVLKDSDEWAIIKSIERIQKACNSITIDTPNGNYHPTVSAGGAVFDKILPPLSVMKQAEDNLFEMQNIKGTGTYNYKIPSSTPIPVKPVQNENKRRFNDR